jgi:cytoskeletal protein CcmA (bactofilin family)
VPETLKTQNRRNTPQNSEKPGSERSQLAALAIPQQATIEGALDYPGPLVISGVIEGDVTCAVLTVTERGVINGAVTAPTVTVLGEINGEIVANSLTLKAACSVTGDIYHNHLILEDGCFFEGRSRRLATPLAR